MKIHFLSVPLDFFFLKSSSLYSTSIGCLQVSNPFKMNQCIPSIGSFNESRLSPFFFFFGWGGRICPSEGIWVLVSQARNMNSHLLDIDRLSVATTHVQHFELLFQRTKSPSTGLYRWFPGKKVRVACKCIWNTVFLWCWEISAFHTKNVTMERNFTFPLLFCF